MYITVLDKWLPPMPGRQMSLLSTITIYYHHYYYYVLVTISCYCYYYCRYLLLLLTITNTDARQADVVLPRQAAHPAVARGVQPDLDQSRYYTI